MSVAKKPEFGDVVYTENSGWVAFLSRLQPYAWETFNTEAECHKWLADNHAMPIMSRDEFKPLVEALELAQALLSAVEYEAIPRDMAIAARERAALCRRVVDEAKAKGVI